jgi:hypothetical protein
MAQLNDCTEYIDTYTGHFDVSPEGGVCWMGDPAMPIDLTPPSTSAVMENWPAFAWDFYNPEQDIFDPDYHLPIAHLYNSWI